VRKIAISELIGQMNLFKRRKKGFLSGKTREIRTFAGQNTPL
jgi:hypothetical protein